MELIRYTQNQTLTNYMPLPRSLLPLELPTTALVLYALLLDRATLSQKNDYTDFAGWVYVVYPVGDLAQALCVSNTTIKNNLSRLEAQGLIRRIRRSIRDANRIFVLVPGDAVTATNTDQKRPLQGRKTDLHRDQKLAPNNIRKQQDHSNHYQHGEEESL